MDNPKIITFDIETSDMYGDIGNCLVFGWKILGEDKVQVISMLDFPESFANDPTDDSPLIKEAHRILGGADIIITYYGKGFDRKFLNTRITLQGLKPLPPLSSSHIDLYFTVRSNFLLRSKKLENVCKVFGCPIAKTPFDPIIWNKARAGHKPSMKYIIDHNIRDVGMLEWLYLNKLRPYVREHPYVADNGACRACGGTRFQRRGYTVSTKKRMARVVCVKCGHWSTRPIEE